MARPKQIIYPLRYFGFSAVDNTLTAGAFEEHLTSFLGGSGHVRAIGRARGGIYLLTKLALRNRRRKVILSSYTIPDVVNMVRWAGGEPVFVDCCPDSTNIDLEKLYNLIDEATCCVIITHYHFNQNALNEIRGLCLSKDIMLVDDCALAFRGTPASAGTDRTTDASVFSFSGFKTLNFVWGGAIKTTSSELMRSLNEEIDKWPRLRWAQYSKQVIRIMKYDLLSRNAIFSALTFPLLKRRALRSEREVLPLVRVESDALDTTILSRPSMWAIQELDRKLGTVESFARHRQSISRIYIRELHDHLVSKETSLDVRERSCLVNCPIHVDPERRSAIYKKIFSSGFDVGLSLYSNVHELEGFRHFPGRTGNVSRLVRSVITLPTHPRISEEYASQLARVIRGAIHSA